ncbi:shikimate kinase [Thermococcus stetteri]|uniref:shikimate kinase n=1 Tax=Thermococcus stetteri TaxID=49900 RepID=UPI001AE86E2E|nr:shikimate kinase [Thermococcus stetteri]MBP1912801.1 shikimate kinase [Thermococcus stetteri]
MRASASSAVTVVNAFATGIGSAIGIDLWTRAKVKLAGEGIEGEIRVRGERVDDFRLIKVVVDVFREKAGEDFGVRFKIESEIPIGMGLKSSSAVANALSKALTDALGLDMEDLDVIKAGVEGAKRAGVTITGAFDDACASYFGSLWVTDNRSMKVLLRSEVEPVPVVVLLPGETLLTESLSGKDFSSIKPYVEEAVRLVLGGEWRKAALINGLLYSTYLGHSIEPFRIALERKAVVGLSGKGPAMFAVTEEPEELAEEWRRFGEVITTELR